MLTTPVSTQVPSTADTNYVCVSLGSITANSVANAGDTIEVIADFERSAAVATVTLLINIGGTCVADANGFASTGTNIGTVGDITSTATSVPDWSTSMTIGLAFKTSASGATDVKLNTARVMFYPAP
jgi:hypothetical protein